MEVQSTIKSGQLKLQTRCGDLRGITFRWRVPAALDMSSERTVPIRGFAMLGSKPAITYKPFQNTNRGIIDLLRIQKL